MPLWPGCGRCRRTNCRRGFTCVQRLASLAIFCASSCEYKNVGSSLLPETGGRGSSLSKTTISHRLLYFRVYLIKYNTGPDRLESFNWEYLSQRRSSLALRPGAFLPILETEPGAEEILEGSRDVQNHGDPRRGLSRLKPERLEVKECFAQVLTNDALRVMFGCSPRGLQ